ncbi:MAG: cell division protein SepF [Nitrososphaerales archaeon]
MTQEVLAKKGSRSKDDKIYLKAFPLRALEELPKIKDDVSNRMIIILRVTPLAQKNVEDLKEAIEELYDFATSIGGDIARLGEERVVITPPGVKIWRGLV